MMELKSFSKSEARIISKLTWRIMPFLFLLYIIAYIDRINVGFAALQMQKQLGFSDAVYGAGAGVFFTGYMLFQVPSNWMLERVGARRWIAFLILTWGIVSCSMMFIASVKSFYTMRFLLGVTEAGFFPGMIFYLKLWFPAAARARSVALFMTASPMAGVVGGPISGALLNLSHAGLAGWQWMFLLEGVPAILMSGVVFYYLKDKPEDAAWLTDAECNWLVTTLKAEQHLVPAADVKPWHVIKIGAVWLLTLVYFGMSATIYGISFWLPKLIRAESGFSNVQIGFLSAIPYLAAAVVMVLVGQSSDRTGERRLHIAGCAVAGMIALIVSAYTSNFVIMLAGISVALMAANSMYGPFWALPPAMLPGVISATSIAFINSLGNLGGFAGPYAIGLLKTSSGAYRQGLLAVSAMLAFTACVALALRPPARQRTVVAAAEKALSEEA
jgi:MFS transporter, ACS family, tartrate transporter